MQQLQPCQTFVPTLVDELIRSDCDSIAIKVCMMEAGEAPVHDVSMHDGVEVDSHKEAVHHHHFDDSSRASTPRATAPHLGTEQSGQQSSEQPHSAYKGKGHSHSSSDYTGNKASVPLSHYTPFLERRREFSAPSIPSSSYAQQPPTISSTITPTATGQGGYSATSGNTLHLEGYGLSRAGGAKASVYGQGSNNSEALSLYHSTLPASSSTQLSASVATQKSHVATAQGLPARYIEGSRAPPQPHYISSGPITPTVPGLTLGRSQTAHITPHASHTFQSGLPSAMSGGSIGIGGDAASSSSSSIDSFKTGHQGGGAYRCPNCNKSFARDDLLRRHLAREARAQTQPALDRQKSCFECARSKARCDLEVPMCGRCRARGKECSYGARSGNPNVRKSMRLTEESSIGTPGPHWGGTSVGDSGWSSGMAMRSGGPSHAYAGSSADDYESSDDSQAWSGSLAGQQQYRLERTPSEQGPFDYRGRQDVPVSQGGQYNAPYPHPSYGLPHDTPTLARGFATGNARGIDTSVSRVGPEEDEMTPINRQAVNAGGIMGPPLIAPSRLRDSSVSSQRPEVPRLLTGARMPRPAEAGQGSARPLFSAQLDLSGWLEEPVVPSPLYRMGPSLSSLGSAAFIPPTPLVGSNAYQSLNAALLQPNQNAQADGDMSSNDGGKQGSQVAARNWWAASSEERQEIDIQNVAQVCAGHFTLYPALMVLPDPTSPVPPLFHRPWLAQTRLETPTALAHVRVALAAYHVRLPASESIIWEMIANQARSIVASVDSLTHASDMDVFANTASLWFLIILLLMSSDPNTGIIVGGDVVDASLIALSHLARILHQRVRAMEDGRRLRRSSNTPTPFVQWGFEETARRTLYACYALFVLQRFRETSSQLQSQLADVELILDIKLPASASEFEAGSELEWRAAQHIQITDMGNEANGSNVSSNMSADASLQDLTLRSLLDARRSMLASGGGVKLESAVGSALSGPQQKRILSYFDRHDDFTNVCLTTAFALDNRII